jgi:hypothetical protein
MAAGDLRVNRRVKALFKAMSADFLLREQFVTDPAQILAEYVGGESLPPEIAAAANQLLYAVLSNPGLLKWVREYAIARRGAPVSGDTFARDFSRAVAHHADEEVLLGLIRGASESRDFFTAQSSLLRAIITALGDSAGSVFAGTEMSPGPSGTEHSGTGGGTERTPETFGRTGEVDVQVTLDALVQYAYQVRRSGALDVIDFRLATVVADE